MAAARALKRYIKTKQDGDICSLCTEKSKCYCSSKRIKYMGLKAVSVIHVISGVKTESTHEQRRNTLAFRRKAGAVIFVECKSWL